MKPEDPEPGYVSYQDNYCESCGNLDAWRAAVYDGGTYWCLFCAEQFDDIPKEGLALAKRIEEARKTIYYKAVKEMQQVTTDMLKEAKNG